MEEQKKKTFGISDRYMRKLHKDIVLNILIILVFFILFNILFQDHPNYNVIRIVFIFVFLVIGVLVIISDWYRVQKYASIYYKVTSNYLEYFDSKKTVQYPWSHFKKVRLDKNKISLVFPYEFQTEDGNFYLHKQLGEQEILIPMIIEKVRSYAEIDPEIPDIFQPKDSLLDDIKRMI